MKKLILLLAFTLPCYGQLGNVVMKHFTSDPAGVACSNNQQATLDTTGALYNCDPANHTFVSAGAAGAGTVTSFSAGDLSPLFTSSVATSSSTPALTFALTNAAANTFLGNNTGSSAAPAYVKVPLAAMATQSANTILGNYTAGSAVPSAGAAPSGGTSGCAGTTDAVIYTTSSGWGCHQISGSGLSGLTTTAIMAAASATTAATPSATTTLDSSGNISTPGSLTTGSGGSAAGYVGFGAGTAPTISSGFYLFAPSSISTAFGWSAPTAENGSAGLLHLGAASSHISAATVSAVVDADLSGTVGVAHGGTALSTLTAHAVYVGNGASAPAAVSVPAADAILYGTTAADPSFKALPTSGTNGCSGSGDALQWNNSTHAWACLTGIGAGGSGTVNSGTATHIPYYATSAAAVSDSGADLTFNGTHTWALGASGILDLHSAATSGFLVPGGFATGLLKVTTSTGAVSSVSSTRGIAFSIGDPGGSALTAASTTTAYVTVPFACTISGYNLLIDAGTITVKFWKVATGTAIPTSGNSISTSGVGISTGTAIHSATTSDFTTLAVSANDIMAMNVTAVATAKYVQGVIPCDQ